MNQVNKVLSRISVAPMMDWTDRHCRFFHRLISPNSLLYTEMKTTGALLNGDTERFLRFDQKENPVALQLGGSNPEEMARCSIMAEDQGYNEVNINCGCPSDRVQKGKIGAILMETPEIVAESVLKMRKNIDIPVTVKCRIGIDHQDSYEFLDKFINIVKESGCKTFIIHARKAWLNGLSPKENRTKPEINYARVKEVKKQHPELNIVVNGEIKTISQIKEQLEVFDGVMIGREAYQNPYFLAHIEKEIFQNNSVRPREDICREMVAYIEKQSKEHGTPVKSITRHMIGLFHLEPGAKKWRQSLSTLPHLENANSQVINEALRSVAA